MASLASLKASLGELLKKSEREAAQNAAKETERALAKESFDSARESQLNKTFGGEPNFEMVGEPQSKDFSLVGEPYGGQPAVIPKAKIPEVLPPEAPMNLPATLPEAGTPMSISPEALDTKSLNIPKAYKVGGAALAAGLGANALMGEDPVSQQAAPIPSTPDAPIVPPVTQEASETESAFKRLSAAINSNNSGPQMKTLDVDGGFNLGTDENLKAALNERDRLNKIANISAIGNDFFKNATGLDQKNSLIDELRKKGDRGVKDLQDRVENQKNDPQSTMSKAYRAQFESIGIKFKGTPSAADLEKQFPIAAVRYNAEENRKARKDEMVMKAATMTEEKQKVRTERNDRFIQGLRKEATSGQAGKAYENYAIAERMSESIAEFSKDPSGYSDYGTLMGGLKALQGDSSVVKEAEIRLGMNAASLTDRIKNWNDQLISGNSLQDSQRKEMIRVTKILSETARKQYSNTVEPIRQQAEQLGINPDLIFRKSAMKASEAAQSDNVTIQDSSGKRHTLPKKSLEAAKKRDPGLKVVN